MTADVCQMWLQVQKAQPACKRHERECAVADRDVQASGGEDCNGASWRYDLASSLEASEVIHQADNVGTSLQILKPGL